ncbi:MAG: insulinase family protein, partial [Muribaculaceae bacterium]|nr:insulinase family protein [Muribaculaceae bacterium]
VESTVTLLSDVGLFTIYFGSDHRHTAKCRRLIDDELRRIADGGITERALNAAKKQYIGQLIVSSESSENRALSLGKEVLNFGTTLNVEAVANRIRAVSADDIRAVGQMLCSNLSTLTFR